MSDTATDQEDSAEQESTGETVSTAATDQIVVVGVDGSQSSLKGARVGSPLRAGLFVAGSRRLGLAPTRRLRLRHGDHRRGRLRAGTAKEELAAELKEVHERFPDVTFEALVVNDQAAPALVEASAGSALLVVGGERSR